MKLVSSGFNAYDDSTDLTYMEPEVSLQHGAEVLSYVTHAGVKSRHQTRVEGQKVQPARGVCVSNVTIDYDDSTPWWCREVCK